MANFCLQTVTAIWVIFMMKKCGHQAQYSGGGGGGGCSKGSDELPFLSKGKGKGVISNVARQGRGGVSAKAL